MIRIGMQIILLVGGSPSQVLTCCFGRLKLFIEYRLTTMWPPLNLVTVLNVNVRLERSKTKARQLGSIRKHHRNKQSQVSNTAEFLHAKCTPKPAQSKAYIKDIFGEQA